MFFGRQALWNEREVRRKMDDALCSRSGALCFWHQALSDE